MNTNGSPSVPAVQQPPEVVFAPAKLWTVAECARYLGKSPRWLWSALARRPDQPGSVPHVRVGSSPRFFPDEIAAWVRAGCPPAAVWTEWKTSQEKRRK